MGTIKFFGAAVMVSLFAIAIVTFAITFASDNDAAFSAGDDGNLSSLATSANTTLEDWSSEVTTSGNTFMVTTQEAGDQSATGGGQFKGGISNALSSATTSLKIGFTAIFGENGGFQIFFTALSAFLFFMVALYAWKAWKGNPD